MCRILCQPALFALKVARLQVPRHARQPYHQPVQLLAHLDLTAQPTRLGESKGQVQHVVLVIIRLLHLIVVGLVLYNDVTRRAGAGAAACALHFDVVCLCDVEEVVAVCDVKRGGMAVFVDKGDFASGIALLARYRHGHVKAAHSSPGRGGSRCPWRDAGLAENWRRFRSHDGLVAATTAEGRNREDGVFCVCSDFGHVAVVQLLENLCGVDDALLAPAILPAKRAEQVLLAAISGASFVASETSKGVLGDSARGGQSAQTTNARRSPKSECADNSECCETSGNVQRTDRSTSLSMLKAHSIHHHHLLHHPGQKSAGRQTRANHHTN